MLDLRSPMKSKCHEILVNPMKSHWFPWNSHSNPSTFPLKMSVNPVSPRDFWFHHGPGKDWRLGQIWDQASATSRFSHHFPSKNRHATKPPCSWQLMIWYDLNHVKHLQNGMMVSKIYKKLAKGWLQMVFCWQCCFFFSMFLRIYVRSKRLGSIHPQIAFWSGESFNPSARSQGLLESGAGKHEHHGQIVDQIVGRSENW